jgi:hypothetical protein
MGRNFEANPACGVVFFVVVTHFSSTRDSFFVDNDLQMDFNDLRTDFNDLRMDFNDLRMDFNDLRMDFNDLRMPEQLFQKTL